jgi:hypothetical protein
MKTKLNTQNTIRSAARNYLRVLCLVPLSVIAIAAGCKPDAKIAPGPDPVGTYQLVSVDGKKVPCNVKHDQAELTIKAGTFIIQADGTCISKMAFSVESRGDASREVKATYTRQGSELTMKWEGAGTTVGTVQGSTFTMNNEGMVLVFSKQ